MIEVTLDARQSATPPTARPRGHRSTETPPHIVLVLHDADSGTVTALLSVEHADRALTELAVAVTLARQPRRPVEP